MPYANPQYLVETDRLDEHLQDDNLRLIEVTGADCHAVVTLDASPHHTNPLGVMAGGILSALADIAMAIAHDTLLEEHEGGVTLELKINFIKPVRDGALRAVGRVLTKGRRISVVESDVRNADADLVAHATGTFMIVSAAP